MAIITKTPRLGEAIKEFNVGKETLVEFLTDKGFDIKNANPGTKLTEQMYNALLVEFASDKAAKRRSEEIVLAKGSLLDNFKKTKEDHDIPAKKEEPAAEKAKPKEEKPTEAEKPRPAEVKEEVKKPVATQAPAKEETPAKKAPTAEKEEAAAKNAPVAKAEEKPKATAKAAPPIAEAEPAEAPEHLDVKAPKIEGPNILGKINLDDMNLTSRPKKGAAKKKETTKKEATAAEDSPKPAKATAKAKKEIPDEPVVEKQPEISLPEAAPDEEGAGRPEHIEMKAPKLEGLKLLAG